jgi:hypothetical protein
MSATTQCERCGEYATKEYRFYYGKEVGTPGDYINKEGYVAGEIRQFEIGGSESVRICDKCAVGGLWDRLFAEAGATPERRAEHNAYRKAIALRKGALGRQGWTHFWEPDQYRFILSQQGKF